MEESQLKIVIKAIDEASATLKKISDSTTQMGNAITQSTQKSSQSFGDMFKAMLGSQVAFSMLERGFEAVKGFLEESVKAAIKESATLAQVKVDVQNAGLSYEKLAPQIEEVAKQHVALGFADDDTQLSMGKLILATGSYNSALKLNQLAMDLSRAKNIDLNSATVLVQQVMAGNTRVLKQYGISLDSATTSGEALNILHNKLKGSAEAFGNTSAGKAAEVSAQWEKMQEDVGNALMPVLIELFNAFEKNLPEIEKSATDVAKAITDIANIVIKALPDVKAFIGAFVAYNAVAFIGGIWGSATAVGGLTTSLTALNTAIMANPFGIIAAEAVGAYVLIKDSSDKLANANAQVQESTSSATDKATQLAQAYNKVHKEKLTPQDFGAEELKTSKNWLGITSVAVETHTINVKALREATKDLAKETENQAKKQKDSSNIFGDIPNQMHGATTAMVKHKDAVAQLSVEYDKMSSSGNTDLASLADSFNDKMKSINASIASTRQSIADLTASYSQTQTDNTKSAAETIVASETKIADIKKQMLTAVGQSQYQSLADQLAAEQANYDSSQAFRDANATAIEEARRRAKETDLQRTIEDYNARAILDSNDYTRRMAQLQQELKDKQAEAVSEQLIYTQKTTAIQKIMDDANTYFAKLSNDRLKQTTDEVNAEIKQFQALASAISQVKSASSSAISTIKIPTTSVAKHESGGFIDAPRGTAVPIIAHGGEMVIPAEQSGRFGGSNVSIVINNPVVRNDADLSNLRKQIDEVLRPLFQNTKIIHS